MLSKGRTEPGPNWVLQQQLHPSREQELQLGTFRRPPASPSTRETARSNHMAREVSQGPQDATPEVLGGGTGRIEPSSPVNRRCSRHSPVLPDRMGLLRAALQADGTKGLFYAWRKIRSMLGWCRSTAFGGAWFHKCCLVGLTSFWWLAAGMSFIEAGRWHRETIQVRMYVHL